MGEREGGYERRAEAGAGAGGDPRPGTGEYLREIAREVRTAIESPSVFDRKVHEGKARVAALKLIRVATPGALMLVGRELINGVKKHPEAFPIAMGTYKAIRDAYSIELARKAIEVRALMGLPTRGRVFPH